MNNYLLEGIKPGEIKLSLNDNYTTEEIKQLIALETGNILTTSKNVIPTTNKRLRKILYIRNTLLEDNIIISDSMSLNYITDIELDALISLIKKNFMIPVAYKFNNPFIWRLLNKQVFNVNNIYSDISITEENKSTLKTLDAVYSYKGLLKYYLNYLSSSKYDLIDTSRYYRIMLWFAINNFYNIYSDLIYSYTDLNIRSDIEALCLLVNNNKAFNVTSIFSIIKYFILLQAQTADNNFGQKITSFKVSVCFKQNINRNIRRRILQQIDNLRDINNIPEIYKPYIKALDKRLHPSDYKNIFPNAYKFFVLHRDKSNKQSDSLVSSRINSEISKMYKENDASIIQIASLVCSKYPTAFISRFDSFARRAEKEGKESYLLDILIDTDFEVDYLITLKTSYLKKLDKIKIKEERSNNFHLKPTVNKDFIECVLDIIEYKLNKNN